MSFQIKMENISHEKNSNVVLALDFPFEKPENRGSLFIKAKEVLNAAAPHICAVKINHHLVLPLGAFDGVKELVEIAHSLKIMTIIDCKANDIGLTNLTIAKYYYAVGFDALIANPFVGWEEGLRPIFETAQELGRGIILLVYMSHKGASEGYGQTVVNPESGERLPQYVLFARKAVSWGADGVIVGATYPEKIKEVHEIVGRRIPIYSPGIGVQGGEIKAALKAGARFLIVGRAIVQAQDPAEAAKEIKELARV